jgi:hypothetical protein
MLGIDGEPGDLRIAHARRVRDGDLREQFDGAEPENDVSCTGVREELLGDRLRERYCIHDSARDDSAFGNDFSGDIDHVDERSGRGKRHLGRRSDGDGAGPVLGIDSEPGDLRFAHE